ncbi:MAG: AAA family ATPase [Candidatus Kerfeldbacteria bacterium RIFCSPHIGHO2_12_FULL_48_17]|uniref:Replication-associated recombination protein A n=1 Tax=Candidatus Kerfeldbacteria bacterium RIFCSPHIGHO2_12_FULL_48_17 TaxID=1798542 RepID=A0A1G2B7C0_9BACT|nr:MAG: AAA family ATPase [Candidatus Kerfeldbacteria bacterium RIFCSPHIGHO2_12_FULL_48_17]
MKNPYPQPFQTPSQPLQPLADRLRAQTLVQYVGQTHLVGTGKVLRSAIESDQLPSMIFWGPPGSGKTTLGHIIAKATKSEFVKLSAISSGVKDIRAVFESAAKLRRLGTRTIIFIDEIHRFNKGQQDVFLPYVENGTVILIGATTENPSFEVNAALLSRCRVFVLNLLESAEIVQILERALSDETNGLGGRGVKAPAAVLDYLAKMSNGDARVALNALELAVQISRPDKKGATTLKQKDIQEALQKTHLLYDRAGEQHYNIISALHKSMRGGDADAALYWLGRMLQAGEDPLYIARRLVRFASEDIGLANSQALVQAVAAYQACHFIGMPECEVNLAQATVYMALSKKSNVLYAAYGAVKQDIMEMPNEPVPLHLRNAPTKLMKQLNYGKGYKYTPDFETPEEARQDYLPDSLRGKKYIQ